MSKMKIAVIGDGIAAHSILFDLGCRGEFELTQYYDRANFKACSESSTAMNCLRGTQKGISELGDLIVESYNCFEKFLNKYQPDGVDIGKEIQFWSGESQFDKRYPDYVKQSAGGDGFNLVNMEKCFANKSYFIDFPVLRNWMIKHNPTPVEQIEQTVISIKDKIVKTLSSSKKYDYIVVATNSKSAGILKGLDEQLDYYLDHSKPVAGSYLEMDNKSFSFDESLCLAVGKHHFIYRKAENRIQIGSTHNNQSNIELADMQALKKIYKEVMAALKFEVPKFNEFNYKTGVRFKGYKRKPYWGEIYSGIYVITGLYKNGFTFAFQASDDFFNHINR